MSKTLIGKVALVTGGSRSIGAAIAKRLPADGAAVALTYSASPHKADEVVRVIEAADGKALAVRADASDVDAVKAAVAKTVQSFGRLDILVNNAGAFAQRPLENIDQQLVTSLFATNILGPTLLSQAALPYLKVTQGSIVNISSTFGHKAAPLISHYAASKAALEHLTRCWALELAPYRIRVNAVAPGPTETGILERSGLPTAIVDQIKEDEVERVPLGRRGTPEEVAAWIVDLANPTASWITGQVIAVDGGLSIA